jgi:glucokinase
MSGRRVIGVDAGGTKLLVGAVGDDMRVHRLVRRLWRGGDREEVVEVMAAAVQEAREAAPDAEAVGLGIPSLIDFRRGTSLTSVHLPLDGVPLREVMAERLGLPVCVDNDANAAVVAEHRHGAARGARDVVLLTLGTGIGGGLLLGGRVYRGSFGAGGELGHIVVDIDGPECFGGCPGRGCLEALVSGSALARDGLVAARSGQASRLERVLADGGEITAAAVAEAALAGDAVAREVVERAGRSLGAGITGLVNAFNPEVVVVGGGVMASGELLLRPAREVVAARALRPSRDGVRIVPAALGEEAGMLGAAALALDMAAGLDLEAPAGEAPGGGGSAAQR